MLWINHVLSFPFMSLLLGTCCDVRQQAALQTPNCPSRRADSNYRSSQSWPLFSDPLTLPSAVAEYWFFHFSFLWHLTDGRERGDTAANAAVRIIWQLRDWGPITLFRGGTAFHDCTRKSLSRVSERRWEFCSPVCTQKWVHQLLGEGRERREYTFDIYCPGAKGVEENLEYKMNILTTAAEKEYSCWSMLLVLSVAFFVSSMFSALKNSGELLWMMRSGFLGAMFFLTLAPLPCLTDVRWDARVISAPGEIGQLVSAFPN